MTTNNPLPDTRDCQSLDERLANRILQENSVLYAKISDALNCEREIVSIAMREVIRFLILVADNRDGKLTPSHRVDLAWHEFILCTRAYCEFCEATFGRFIHHHPGGSGESNQRQFAETLKRYESRFGIPDPRFWGKRDQDTPACGACESL